MLTGEGVPFAQVFFELEGPKELPKEVTVRYSVLFDIDPLHRALLVVQHQADIETESPAEAASLIFSADKQIQELSLEKRSSLELLFTYIGHGAYHISIGLDHILFLVALMLSAVLVREESTWVGVTSFRVGFLNVLWIVTTFTVAHSITLSLAALKIVTLPSRFVESMIAVTIVAAAAHNLFPMIGKRILPIIFFFGLFHGFGFASQLSGLGFQQYSLIVTLLGFNVGVELGQLVIVAVAFPLLYLGRHHRYYAKAGLTCGSLAIAVMGTYWFLERSLNVQF